jgi:hypothetical protein
MILVSFADSVALFWASAEQSELSDEIRTSRRICTK